MTRTSSLGWVAGFLAVSVAIVVAAAFFASGDPDGLERVAEDHGFASAAQDSPFTLIADYAFPGLDGPASSIVAVLIGVVVVFALLWLAGKALARRRDGSR
jgi:PDGLE domain